MSSAKPSIPSTPSLRVDVDACLARRAVDMPCDACAQVCPAQAMHWTAEGVEISAACLGCGRCAAVCPSGAVQFVSLALGDSASPSRPGRFIEQAIECARVPVSMRHASALSVRCLGGLRTADLLGLLAAGRIPVLVDRGWCGECVGGGASACSTDEVLEAVRGDLHSLGLPEPQVSQIAPRWAWEPLPPKRALPLAAEPSVGQPTLSRRHFFATLRRGAPAIAAIRARSADRRTQAACRPSATVAQHQREHSQALHALAAHVGQPLTAQALPRVVAHDNCQLDGLCAAACPSGALRLVESEDGSQAGLDFDAATCLGCGLCARLCPHAALSVHTAGEANQALGSGPEPLIRRVQQRCATCGTAWVPTNERPQCPQCAARAAQAQALFGCGSCQGGAGAVRVF